MALQKYLPSSVAPSLSMTPLNFSKKVYEKAQLAEQDTAAGPPVETDIDIDIREVYFLIMHFLSAGPCHRTFGQFWNELLEHQLLPRRYHAWYSRTGVPSGDENDNGLSFPLSYNKLVDRYPHIEKDHLVKLLKQLILSKAPPLLGMVGGNAPNAADVPTLLGTGSFSLMGSDQKKENKQVKPPPGYLRWPHIQADQLHGLSLREIGGGFSRHHRAPSVRAACYAIAKPLTMVQKMQNIKKLRGHRDAVYCAIFDRTGRYVITGSDDRLVKIWSMETAFCLASCRGHEGDITDLAVSSNNALVASSSNDFIIRVWRLPDGLPISVLRGHTGAVTAIAFSPRPSSVYQLLSSSDDGTCRIWDARYSHLNPRIYVPKPSDAVAGKISGPSSSNNLQSHQILCCAFNANGTVFVTGSSDTFARVWNACKSNTDDAEQPNHEMDVLSGHENDVNYVQFSGCSVASRSSTVDASKEENLPKFKNSWFTHDNIVTCSRDGSAIIWIPRSRRSHGKVGRWTRAYHLKVPPPPMPPQPPRGGPRQRFLPTPRGVNMIMWSLDNRFVLAAIMDCRICVWNAVDGSLVHSLTGHNDSTYVLDVHPFNPRIAMSAGYDGKTIVWDIWEGTPIRTYETGRFKLVDGKFSPDGTSIVLSDDVGQIYILNTGQGESQKDAKYDQFFLGDYRPLIQDTHGNVLDQETQLAPHRRNIQDLLCDSNMIPYPEPYQSMYQQRRLGALGIEWRPSSVKLAVGADVSLGQDYQMLPLLDLDRMIEPLPEFIDAIDWEPENDVQSDDTDSEYNVTEEYSSEGEQGSLSTSSPGDTECSAEAGEVDHEHKDGLRRSKRKKHNAEADFMTSSGRRVRRRNLDERDGTLSIRRSKTRKSRNSRKASRRKSSTSKSLRPQRVAARNALTLFSQITGKYTDGEDEDGSEDDLSGSDSMLQDSNIQSNESDSSLHNVQQKHPRGKEVSFDDSDDVIEPPESHTNAGNRKRLVVKFSLRDSNKLACPENKKPKRDNSAEFVTSSSKVPEETNEENGTYLSPHDPGTSSDAIDMALSQNFSGTTKIRERGQSEAEDHLDLSAGYRDNEIRWGGLKARSSKRFKMGDAMQTDACALSSANLNCYIENSVNGILQSENKCGMGSPCLESQINGDNTERAAYGNDKHFKAGPNESLEGASKNLASEHTCNSSLHDQFPLDDNEHGRGHFPLSCNGSSDERFKEHFEIKQGMEYSKSQEIADMVANDDTVSSVVSCKNELDLSPDLKDNPPLISTKFRIRSKRRSRESQSPSNLKFGAAIQDRRNGGCDRTSEMASHMQNTILGVPEEAEGASRSRHSSEHGILNKSMDHIDDDSMPILQDLRSLHSDSSNKMYDSVYRRSKSYKGNNVGGEVCGMEEGTSNTSIFVDRERDFLETTADGVRRTRSMGMKATTRDTNVAGSSLKVNEGNQLLEASRGIEKFSTNTQEHLLREEWRSNSNMTVGLRSARNRRGNYYGSGASPLDKRKSHYPVRKMSWLMSENEESYRYIPQQGDEVVYLRQGHQEYLDGSRSHEIAPWRAIKGILSAVEICKVVGLDYSTLPGSGESCCKLTLEFIDAASIAFGKKFKLTLPELIGFPEFLVERTRYDAAIRRNWTHRDKCQVWWTNDDDDGGNWWEGRILTVKPKSPEFPDSPWERYVIQYKGDPTGTHLHSPWELHDSPDAQYESPHIDDESRNYLLSSFDKLERIGYRNQDYYGTQKLKQVARKSEFLNRFPVPLSVELIHVRVENNYYRSLEAVKHDITVMLCNFESYFGKNVELASKMRRLKDWFSRMLLDL